MLLVCVIGGSRSPRAWPKRERAFTCAPPHDDVAKSPGRHTRRIENTEASGQYLALFAWTVCTREGDHSYSNTTWMMNQRYDNAV
jgi:hypothetical protein